MSWSTWMCRARIRPRHRREMHGTLGIVLRWLRLHFGLSCEPTPAIILITLIGSLCHRSLLPHGPHILVYQIDALSLSFPLTGPAVSSFANAERWHHLRILTYAPTLVCSFKSLNPSSDLSDLFRHSQGFWVRRSVR